MYNILIFGDSIAAGRGIRKIKSWPCLLAQYIDREDKKFVLVQNLSIPGESTTEVVKRFVAEVEARQKKIYEDDQIVIVFAIGINDAKCVGLNKNSVTPLRYFKNNIAFLLDKAERYTKKIIFIGLTPVNEKKTALGVGNIFFFNNKIKEYNEVISKECKKKGVVFLSIFEDWLKINYTELLSDDGLHPNEKGHHKIFLAIKSFYDRK